MGNGNIYSHHALFFLFFIIPFSILLSFFALFSFFALLVVTASSESFLPVLAFFALLSFFSLLVIFGFCLLVMHFGFVSSLSNSTFFGFKTDPTKLSLIIEPTMSKKEFIVPVEIKPILNKQVAPAATNLTAEDVRRALGTENGQM